MGLLPFKATLRGDDCILAVALHAGHDIRPDVDLLLALDESTRLREEDPFTDALAQVAKIQIVGLRSRFEVDLNRPRERAVYLDPDDAWGHRVWKSPPEPSFVQESLRHYDQFYSTVLALLSRLLEEHNRVVVLDVHSYNHLRDGAAGKPAPRDLNPEINVGTGTMDRAFWAPVVDGLIADLRAFEHRGRSYDVRENVRFQGGDFGRWVHRKFPRRVCVPAIEIKKFFMNEWTGECDLRALETVFLALQSTLPGIRESLKGLGA